MDDYDFVPADELRKLQASARLAWLHPAFMFFLAWGFFSASVNAAAYGSAFGSILLLVFTGISVTLGLWTLKVALKYRELLREVREKNEIAIKSESTYMIVEIENYLSGR